MLGTYGLGHIKAMEQAALQRKQSAWTAYTNVERRFDDAYYLLLFAWEEFEDARDDLPDDLQGEGGVNVRLELAKKRHRSAQEEFLYQRKERRRVRAEFEKAQMEHWQWYEKSRQKEGGDDCGLSEVVTN